MVITIIVLLILAGVSLAMLTGQNGILTQAQNAKTKTEVAGVIERVQTDVMGVRAENEGENITTAQFKGILNKYFDDVPENLTESTELISKEEYGKVKVTVSELYAGDIISGNGITVADVASEPETYYGKTVDYTSKNGQTGWKIFHADKETNTIYLIASTYIDVDKLPEPLDASGTKGTKPANANTSYPKGASLSNVLSSYSTGSARVTDSKIKKLNNEFFNVKNFTSTNTNMKAVAYLLDTKAWESFKDTSGKADYVIGGPTLELLFDSYNTRYYSGDKQYQYQAVESGTTNSQGTASSNGYQVSADKGTTWKFYQNTSTEWLKTENDLYAVTQSTDSRSIGLLGGFALCLLYLLSYVCGLRRQCLH